MPSFRQVTYLPDSYFVDAAAKQTKDALTNQTENYAPGSAQQVLDALAYTPNSVLALGGTSGGSGGEASVSSVEWTALQYRSHPGSIDRP